MNYAVRSISWLFFLPSRYSVQCKHWSSSKSRLFDRCCWFRRECLVPCSLWSSCRSLGVSYKEHVCNKSLLLLSNIQSLAVVELMSCFFWHACLVLLPWPYGHLRNHMAYWCCTLSYTARQLECEFLSWWTNKPKSQSYCDLGYTDSLLLYMLHVFISFQSVLPAITTELVGVENLAHGMTMYFLAAGPGFLLGKDMSLARRN
jgi:hypothetical protein